MYQTLSYNMSFGYDMGGGLMNVNANTKAAVKTKQGLWVEENKPRLDTVLRRILTQALFKQCLYSGWEADFKVTIEKIFNIWMFRSALEML